MFVAPKPNPALIKTMTFVNRIVMLRGVPGFRDLLPFNRLAGLRGVANVRHIDFPDDDRQRLKACCGAGQATFITPNHPEFFTDWMIDKEIVSRVSPLAASWATNGVVNGLGRVMQKFWLANNLIAQIPGNSGAAKEHSIDWALKGHGVLLHPEGGVGWHGDTVAPLLPGAVEMGLEALKRGRAADPDVKAWIAPVVWKLAFTGNVEPALAQECAYVEKSLKIERRAADTLPERVHHIYATLLSRDEAACGLTPTRGLRMPHAKRTCCSNWAGICETCFARRNRHNRASAPVAPLAAGRCRQRRKAEAGPNAGGHGPAPAARRAMGLGQSAHHTGGDCRAPEA